jgi:hypothetical protein
MLPHRLGFIASAVLVAACGSEDRTTLQVERDTVGDTIVVRTVAGSVWRSEARLEAEMRIGAFEGEDVYMLGDVAGLAVAPDGAVYLYDRQVPALRKYSADGDFIATFGGEGGGPGEYRQSDGGLTVLPDGRVLLRDPGNARITVYSADGQALDTWPLRGGYFTSRPLYADTAGRVYTQIWGTAEDNERYTALQPFATDGTPGDSIAIPEWDFEPASITFSGERISLMNNVPFTPRVHWSFSPFGYFVGGVSTSYSLDLFRPGDDVLRIQRVLEPTPVDGGEKDAARMGIIRSFRQYGPDWQWNGPGIPDVKPPFQDITVGRDGRIWVQLHRPGYLAEPADPSDPSSADEWAEPVVWDVFEPDGTYLGQIAAPEGFQTGPEPVFDGDQVWAITTDDLDVEYLTRFRIARAGGGPRTAGD